MATVKNNDDLLNTVLHGIIIPSALLIVGCIIVKPEWTAYAILVTAALASLKFYRGRPKQIIFPDQFTEFPLIDKVPVSHNAHIYRFALPRSTDTLGLPTGQHITVTATIDDKEVSRSYTPISNNQDEGHFELLVKHYPEGKISGYLNSLNLQQTIKVKGPKGKMVYQPNMVKHIGMIAGGTGIAPMLQVLSTIVRDPHDVTRVSLIFANVTEEDILLKEDIDEIAEKYPYFKVHYVLNNPPEDWDGSTGFVTDELIREHLPAPSDDTKILICGPPPMVAAMKKVTEAVGYDKASVVSKAEDQVFVF
ncbi:hypothetical protein DV495_000139 [Geotrichum candidum]|uniref:NADH-cytochrome b5 reductase n=1 Tax=Geotrichum candidum TaxID=1173061 RepID=A0A0J9XAW2_GEOCN|nr:hypothetical protein DV452_002640 [Geotrichum candidum]KAF5136068.1 hypothetical protein DV495_000139 [Geotrichum candidum]KAF7501560.1 hypothetical protein DV113_000464 [Geotrichum candidum]KAI8132146.1 hypothetical protein DUD61_004188 [Geotrichum candidum]CDO54300.1 similar to Saccharomyces cerevisiae YIL043C CBR1 Microsomal cytochrome b reductase [Geotrichum candidum]